jgi:hypothetical protein
VEAIKDPWNGFNHAVLSAEGILANTLGTSNPFRDEHCFHSCVGGIDLWDPAAQHEENINAPKSSRDSDTEKHQLTRESFAPLGKNESAAHSGNQRRRSEQARSQPWVP